MPQIAHQLLRASTHLHMIMSFVVAQNQRIHKGVHTYDVTYDQVNF